MTRAFLLTMAIAVGLFAQKMQAEEHRAQVAQNQSGPGTTLGAGPIAGTPPTGSHPAGAATLDLF
ncbi:hypothetical protein [Rhodophyticola porphyridii]|uniref:Tim44 domain-containing protein n=1 Tax=Rhodophyticola porphyridii TaxID=1852017 RepID=A0A3L9Y843_9RHOB|nr:hypothetical protein [Rhodophyticola porphyridii]RMA43448.1 hypothetical protein D9R08_00400 [Rhodophyticola porphyridii]